MNIQIRPFKEEDREAVIACITELKQVETKFDEDYYTDAAAVANLFAEITAHSGPNRGILIAETDGTVVGFLSYQLQEKDDPLLVKPIQTVYVSDIVVRAAYRGKHIGQTLIAAAETYAKEHGIPYLKLVVYSKNTQAKHFYETNGFTEHTTTMLKKLIT